MLCPVYPHLECRVRAPPSLYSRQRHTACPCITCHSQLLFLQAAAAARIADGLDITSAAEDGDVERVRDHLFADPASVHFMTDEYATHHIYDIENEGSISVFCLTL